MAKGTTESIARVAFDVRTLHENLVDPAQVRDVFQGVLVLNLYSPLIDYNNEGQLVAGVASRFQWRDNEVVFYFDHRAVTASGHRISAKDAAISIRRTLKLGTSTHINLSQFLCDLPENSSIFEDCDSVKVEGDKLILKVKDPKFNAFFLQTISSIDFGIVPSTAIDTESLRIKTYSETSGAYYVESVNGTVAVLKANPEHYKLSPRSMKQIDLVYDPSLRPFELLMANKVDVLSTLANVSSAQRSEMSKSISDLYEESTLNLKSIVLKFRKSAVSKFSFEQRAYIASQAVELMKSNYPLPLGAVESQQFFLDVGFGHLKPNEVDEVARARKVVNAPAFPEKVTFLWYAHMKDTFALFNRIDGLEPQLSSENPIFNSANPNFDAFIVYTDTAYEDSLALLGYNFTQGTFGMSAAEGQIWLDNYMSISSKEERIDAVRNLHLKALIEGHVFPLFASPYTAFARNGFKIQLSKIFASTNFSGIEKQ